MRLLLILPYLLLLEARELTRPNSSAAAQAPATNQNQSFVEKWRDFDDALAKRRRELFKKLKNGTATAEPPGIEPGPPAIQRDSYQHVIEETEAASFVSEDLPTTPSGLAVAETTTSAALGVSIDVDSNDSSNKILISATGATVDASSTELLELNAMKEIEVPTTPGKPVEELEDCSEDSDATEIGFEDAAFSKRAVLKISGEVVTKKPCRLHGGLKAVQPPNDVSIEASIQEVTSAGPGLAAEGSSTEVEEVESSLETDTKNEPTTEVAFDEATSGTNNISEPADEMVEFTPTTTNTNSESIPASTIPIESEIAKEFLQRKAMEKDSSTEDPFALIAAVKAGDKETIKAMTEETTEDPIETVTFEDISEDSGEKLVTESTIDPSSVTEDLGEMGEVTMTTEMSEVPEVAPEVAEVPKAATEVDANTVTAGNSVLPDTVETPATGSYDSVATEQSSSPDGVPSTGAEIPETAPALDSEIPEIPTTSEIPEIPLDSTVSTEIWKKSRNTIIPMESEATVIPTVPVEETAAPVENRPRAPAASAYGDNDVAAINATPEKSAEAAFNTKGIFDNSVLEGRNWTKPTRGAVIGCPPPRLCAKNCFVMINDQGCQDCQCLWISLSCETDNDCPENAQICDLGKCVCRPKWEQDMARPGFCKAASPKSYGIPPNPPARFMAQQRALRSGKLHVKFRDQPTTTTASTTAPDTRRKEPTTIPASMYFFGRNATRSKRGVKWTPKPRQSERLQWPGPCDDNNQCPRDLFCIEGDCWSLPDKPLKPFALREDNNRKQDFSDIASGGLDHFQDMLGDADSSFHGSFPPSPPGFEPTEEEIITLLRPASQIRNSENRKSWKLLERSRSDRRRAPAQATPSPNDVETSQSSFKNPPSFELTDSGNHDSFMENFWKQKLHIEAPNKFQELEQEEAGLPSQADINDQEPGVWYEVRPGEFPRIGPQPRKNANVPKRNERMFYEYTNSNLLNKPIVVMRENGRG
ncbi:unnamed protein product, partial [Mesorhabditis spiculigera]